jgi:hypothetical protein
MAASDMKEKAKEVGKQVQEKAGQMGEQIKDQTSQLAGQAQNKVKKTLEEQKGKGIGELSGLAEAVRQTGQTLRDQEKDGIAHYAERAADQIERVVQYVDSRDVTELLNEAEMFARRHPEAFLGGAFMMGLVAGRFLKSSRDHRMTNSRADQEEPMTVNSSPSSTI